MLVYKNMGVWTCACGMHPHARACRGQGRTIVSHTDLCLVLLIHAPFLNAKLFIFTSLAGP